MALILSAASGNFNAGATWTGGIVPGVGDEARASNGHTITITANATCTEISNAGTGTFVLNSGVTLTANCTHKGATGNVNLLSFSAAAPATSSIVGNVTGGSVSPTNAVAVTNTGTLTITGNVTGGASIGNTIAVALTAAGSIIIVGNCLALGGQLSYAVNNIGGGSVTITGNVTGGSNANTSTAVNIATLTGSISVTGNVTGGTASSTAAIINATAGPTNIVGNITAQTTPGVNNSSTGTLTISGGTYTASPVANAVVSTNGGSVVRASGSFIYAINGFVPINAPKFILFSTPNLAKTSYALNGTGAYFDMFTADNSLGQANPTDVRSGVTYASGNLTGRLTVPARGSVALSVNYGPSMPFTATRSGTTATAALAYSYPLVVGDQITVTGASNAEWNSTYTIASVVSGTSITFDVPASHSATAGTGANMQTTGTAVLDPAAVASAVWGAASRTITGGTVDTLTNAPSVPSASVIASQVRTELSPELAKVAALNTTRLAQVSTTEIVGNLLAQANS